MITTTSSSKRGHASPKGKLAALYLSILKKNAGLAVLYFILQFVFFPLQYILTAHRAAALPEVRLRELLMGAGGTYNGVSLMVLSAMVLGMPILMSLLQYSYLHQKSATDLYHSLPIRREKLLLVNYAASATIILAPLLFNYAVVLAAGHLYRLPNFNPVGVLLDLLVNITTVLATLAVCAVTATITGTVFDNLVYTCALLFCLPVMLYLGALYAQGCLYGFTAPDWLLNAMLCSPATLLLTMRMYDEGLGYARVQGYLASLPREYVLRYFIAALIWLALAAAILYVAARLYRRRKSELAGKSGYSNPLILALKLAGALVGGLCLSALLASVAGGSGVVPATLFALFGGALSYCIIECVMARGFKTLKKSLWYIAASMAAPGLVALVMNTGGLGYETRMPALESIDSVEISSYYDRYGFNRIDLADTRENFADTHAASLENRRLSYERGVTLGSPAGKQLLRDLHAQLIQGEEAAPTTNDYAQITYHLTGGGQLRRTYYHGMPADAAETYVQLNALDEVKQQTHPIYHFDAGDIREVTLMNRLMMGMAPAPLTEGQTQALIEALRTDMSAESYQDMRTQKPLGYVVLTPKLGQAYFAKDRYTKPDFMLPEGDLAFTDCYVAITEGYASTLALLAQFGYAGFDALDYGNIAAIHAALDPRATKDTLLHYTGPDYFVQGTYQEVNRSNSYLLTEGAAFTDPADIKILADAMLLNGSDGLLPIDLRDRPELLDMGLDGMVRVEAAIESKDGRNVVKTLYINPQALPESMLRKMEDSFSRRWGGLESGDNFELFLQKIKESTGQLVQTLEGEQSIARFISYRF